MFIICCLIAFGLFIMPHLSVIAEEYFGYKKGYYEGVKMSAVALKSAHHKLETAIMHSDSDTVTVQVTLHRRK